jgi:hypothetical protein
MPVPFLGATGSNVGFRVVSSAEDNNKPMSCRLLAVKVAEDNNDNNNSRVRMVGPPMWIDLLFSPVVSGRDPLSIAGSRSAAK